MFQTPLGLLYAAASEAGVCRITYDITTEAFETDILNRFNAELAFVPGDKLLSSLEDQFTRYFSGKLTHFNMPLDFLRGPPFSRRVWRVLQTIPYGEWRSYKWVATRLRQPNAARAVGQANRNNDIGIIVPCHRVIKSDGRLGGFGGRPDIKAFLLELEGTVYTR